LRIGRPISEEAKTVFTPKRILRLAATLSLLIVAYGVYAHFLPIDGLPQLPDKYLPCDGPPPPPPTTTRRDVVGEKLKLAFNENCKEATNKYPIKFQVPSRHMIMAAGDFNIEHDQEGRVRLSPVSLAIFGKPEPGKFPEINTIRSDVAYLQFDKPIYTLADMSSRKIAKAELRGKIEITNNRRTQQPDDDIIIEITEGPLYFVESEHHCWTEKWVKLTDWQGSPQTTKVNAEGMDLYLSTKQEPDRNSKPGPKKPSTPTVSGVERIVLRSAVTMTLWVDAHSGLLSSGKEPPPTTPASTGAKSENGTLSNPPTGSSETVDKDRVTITTPGTFRYDMSKDFAQFDLPKQDPQHASNYPESVHVDRRHFLSKPDENAQEDPPHVDDYLNCDHLEVQFRRKPATTQAAHDDRTPNLEIETIHATGSANGSEVTLVSDVENFESHSLELFYNALTRQTILKGDPKIKPFKVPADRYGNVLMTVGVWILKEGNEIYVNEIELHNQPGAQRAFARGKGLIRLFDKATGDRPLQASWNDGFTWGQDGKEDLLTLNGNGIFYDDEHDQYLRADTLKVWLLPAEAKPATGERAPSVQNSRRPRRVEAVGHVLAKSPEMYVHDTDNLLIHFKDVPKIESTTSVKPIPPATSGTIPAKPAASDSTAGKAPGSAPPAAQPADKAPNPIDLSAQSVEATVLRGGEKNELDELRCVKAVRVIQKPASPEDNGVDIIGDKLHLTHFPDGNQLVVTGDLAQLRLDKIFIVGPEVNIDQVANKAWVNGIGAMQIENDSDFQGKKLPKPVPLTIHWNKSMMFNGPDAEFHGGIQATQENGRLMCQVLQVYLDRPVSLKEGNKGKEAARVKNLMCDQKVNLHDVAMDGTKLVKDQRLQGTYLEIDNVANTAQAGGPGVVRIFQRGAPDLAPGAAAAPPKPGAGAAKAEMKLTHVTYTGKMWADDKEKIARFYQDVKLIHVPTEDPNLKIDLNTMVDKLPPNGMYMECKVLEVSNKQINDKDNQEMTATGNVFVKAEEFYGRAAKVTYVENKDQVIFDGEKGSAYLYRVHVKGAKPDVIEANKIIYLRKTGEFSVDGGKTFQGRN
jgi:lipopolysaccharide export system protein LptA